MNCCIIGKGSIGSRHSKNLVKLGINTFFLRRKYSDSNLNNLSFQNKKLNKIDFFIISNPSSLHLSTIKKVIKYNKPILVEKPFVTQKKISQKITKFKKIFVLYQMRFDSRINFIKRKINNKKIKKSVFIWKTFLPKWHINENFKNSYASKKSLGGGAIFTMSHEIDLAIYLFGSIKYLNVKTKKNKLKINVEDNAEIFLKHTSGSESKIYLDFSSKKLIRSFRIKNEKSIIFWDFYKDKIKFKNKFIKFKFSNDNIYLKEINDTVKKIKEKKYKYSKIHIDKILHTQEVIMACYKSLKFNKKVILKN